MRDRLQQLRQASADELSLPPAALLDVFAAIRERVVDTERTERAAFTQLRRVVAA